jgi:kynurenine formamidase
MCDRESLDSSVKSENGLEVEIAISRRSTMTDVRPDATHGQALEAGLLGRVGPKEVLNALSLVKTGRIYDLDSTRWSGMPVAGEHPPFQVMTYRSPRGARNQGDIAWIHQGNDVQAGMISDLVMGTMHSGTHIDALSHITCGDNSHWYGGFEADNALGDFGALHCDAASIPPIVTRGILIDVAGRLGLRALPRGFAISADVLAATLQAQGIEVRRNDAVLVRTGYMAVWPDASATREHENAGLDHSAALYLADRGAVLVGSDTEGTEVDPSGVPGNPVPVHIELLINCGIFIAELVNLEELAADRVFEFCFVCLPLRVRGATASMVRPIAVS